MSRRRRVIVVSGRCDTAEALAELEAIAVDLRARHAGAVVVWTPDDVARSAGTREWDSLAFARAMAAAMASADTVILAPGWQDDPHAVVTAEIAEDLGVAVIEWAAAPAAPAASPRAVSAA